MVEAGIDDLSYYAAPSTVGVPGTGGVAARLSFVSIAPNPSRGAVALALAGPEGATVDVAIHDVRGRLVARLPAAKLAGGQAAIRWDGRDQAGRAVPAGVYLVRAGIGRASAVARVVRLTEN